MLLSTLAARPLRVAAADSTAAAARTGSGLERRCVDRLGEGERRRAGDMRLGGGGDRLRRVDGPLYDRETGERGAFLRAGGGEREGDRR